MLNETTLASATGLPEDRPVTAEFAASLEFQPWDAQEEGWRPPTNAEWSEIGRHLLPTVRVAWLTMFKTKAELVDLIEDLDREGIFIEHMQRLKEAQETLEGFLTVLRGAEGRTISAGAVIELRDGEGGDDEQR